MRGLLRSGARKVRSGSRRSYFFYDFLKLLNHPARLRHRFLVIRICGAQLQQFTPNWIPGGSDRSLIE